MAYFGTGEFGAVAKWRANLTEDGLELQAIGSGPSGSPKSKDDIAVAIGGALISQSFAKERGPFAKFEVILLAGTIKNTGYADTTSPMSTGLRTDANPVT